MKKFANRSLSAFLERYLNKVDENQISLLISNGQYEEKNISFKPTFLYSFNFPFIIDSSKIESFKIDANSSPSIFLVEGIDLISIYSDCIEFNPYIIDPPSLSFFSNKIFSEKTVKKILFSFFFKSEKISFILKNCSFHFEIPRCNKADKSNSKNNSLSTYGSFGFLADEISFTENKAIKIKNMSMYVFPQFEHMKIENFESFKNNLLNNSNDSFILQNFDYEGEIDNIQIEKEIILNFNFSQISFLKFFVRKLHYSNCGCPNIYNKNSCLNWWSYSYRCILKDKYCFNINSAIFFLKNRRTFNPNFERDQFLMFNTYKKAISKQTNNYKADVNSVDFSNDEKDAFVDFCNQSQNSTVSYFEYKISFLSKLKIKVRNTVNGFLDLGQIRIQKTNGLTSVSSDQITLSYDFLPFIFLLIKDKLQFKSQNGQEFKMIIPSIKIIDENKSDSFSSIEINNLSIADNGFTIDLIQNMDKTLLISQINAKDTNENQEEDKAMPISIKKNYMINVDKAKLATKVLFSLLFYKKYNENYNNSSPYLNLHYLLYFFNQIEYVLSLSDVSLFIGNDPTNCLTFKMHFVNTSVSQVFGIDEISFGEIIKKFVITSTVNYEYDGISVFFDITPIQISLFPSEIPILMNLIAEIKPLIIKCVKIMPMIKSFIFCSKGITLTLETTEFSLVQLNIEDCSYKSVCGFYQFAINNNQALFYDRKLNKWCVLIQPFNIVSNIQRTNIELNLSLQFNFTRIFFNDIIKFFTSKDERVELPRKIKIKNHTGYPLIIEEKKESSASNNKQQNKPQNDKNSSAKDDNNNDDDIEEEEEDVEYDDKKTRLEVDETVFMNSRKFRVVVENEDKNLNESYTIDSNHLQFPLYISNRIVLSKGENSICFCSPFVIENKTTLKNLCIYQIQKDNNSDQKDYKISLLGNLKEKGSKLGVYNPNILITGENDNATQIFVSHINDSSEEDHEYKMILAISSTFDKKPQLVDIFYNGKKETILVASEFNYEKGALFVCLMNPFVIVNHVPECKSISLSLSATIIPEKKIIFKHKKDDDSSVLTSDIKDLPPNERAYIPIQMIPSCSSFFQNQQQKPKMKPGKNKVINNSFDIIVELNDFLGNVGLSIKSEVSHIIVSDDFQFFPIHFNENQFNFSLALKIQFNPRKGNWSLILFAPSVIENRTNLNISINSIGKENVSNFFLMGTKEKNNRLIFGCDSFFTESRSMPVFVGYNREYKLSDKPIELCFEPFSSPVMLPSLIHKNCFLPLFYRTISKLENNDDDQPKKKTKSNHFKELFTVIDYYKIIENETPFDFTLTPINHIEETSNFASLSDDNNNNNSKNKKKSNNNNDTDNDDDDNKSPHILFKKNEKKPILLAKTSFCYKFEYQNSIVPICLLKDNYRTCFRVEKDIFILLTITEKYARFEVSDFSPQKVFMTITNLLPTESIFLNSSAMQPPICVEPNTTSLFGYDSPFETTNVTIFAFGEQIDFKVDRCYEPLSSPMNKYFVQTISSQSQFDSSQITHSIVVKGIEAENTERAQNQFTQTVVTSPNGENLNADSNLKGATSISIEKESNVSLLSDQNSTQNDFDEDCNDDPHVNSRIMGQVNDRLNSSYDVDDYECFAGYSLTVNVPIFEVSLIDDRLSELALICLYQSSLVINNDRSMTTKTINFSIKSLQVFDMNVMTLFPTVISSNPENANFLNVEIGYFDKLTVDQFKVTISPILISPDIHFLNELCYFLRKIDNISEISNKVLSNNLIVQSKLFNLIQFDPIIIVINIKTQSTRNLNTPKYVTFNKNLTTSFALNGFIIHNADVSPSFFISIIDHFVKMKLNYTKIFYITSPNDVIFKRQPRTIQRQKPKNDSLFFSDDVEQRIVNPDLIVHAHVFPSLKIDPLIEKNLKDKPAKILEALSQTESYFKLASDKMRLISNDKIDRDEYLIPQRKKRSQTLQQTRLDSTSPTAANLNSSGSETSIQGSVKKEKAANAAQTVANGFSSAAKSLGSGFTGIIRKPIEGGKENGARGAFKGIGQGLLGVLTCTVSSVIEVGSGIAGGIRKSIMKDNTSNYEQCRPPSTFLLRCISTNSANNSEDGNGSESVKNICYKQDVKNFFDDELIETAEQAQQVINSGQYLALPKEKEESLVFFSDVEPNQKRIAFIGITTDSIFLLNSALTVLNKFDLESITWFKKKNESFANNDEEFNNDKNIHKKLIFDVYSPLNKKETRYELELTSENMANLAVQFFSSKLRAFDIIRDVQEDN